MELFRLTYQQEVAAERGDLAGAAPQLDMYDQMSMGSSTAYHTQPQDAPSATLNLIAADITAYSDIDI
eukprot:m.48987 g.48987  ORF g.48987 m.48987 type:complete len:68 (-) comp13338_c0_seq1:164-367(-)